MNDSEAKSAEAFEKMSEAYALLREVTSSRENSLAITNLEQAMMWCNKDRTIKGELSPYPTHRS